MTVLTAGAAGSVCKINAVPGDKVKAEDVLVVLESMKMEIPIEAPGSGRIEEIYVTEGDMVDEGQALLVLVYHSIIQSGEE